MTPEDRPPAPFHHLLGAQPPLPPVRSSSEIQELHTAWAAVHEQIEPGSPAPGASGRGPLERARAAAARISAAGTTPSPEVARDLAVARDFTGALIRAADVLAVRCDELADRIAGLESALEEAVATLSEELTAARALLASRTEAPAHRNQRTGDETHRR